MCRLNRTMIYYVDVDSIGGRANDANSGAIGSPLATLRQAHDRSRPGDSVVLRRGTYRPLAGGGWNIRRSGELPSGAPPRWITYQAHEGEEVCLDYSERYRWTYDQANRWWKTALPPNSVAAQYPDIRVVIHEGWAASPILAPPGAERVPPAHFVEPPDAFWDRGKLQYDLTFYDIPRRTLYLKSNEVQPLVNPDEQAHVVSGAMQCHVSGARYVELRGLRFQYGHFGIHANTGACIRIRQCIVKHQFSQGMVIYTPLSEVEGSYVDFIGGSIADKTVKGGYDRDWLHHGLYFGGANSIVRGNFFGRSKSGSSAIVVDAADDLRGTGTLFFDNVCYGGSRAAFLFHSDGLRVLDNVMVTGSVRWRDQTAKLNWNPPGMVAYPNQLGCLVRGNYIEGVSGIESQHARQPNYVDRLAITGNRVNALSSHCLCLMRNVSIATMDSNVWMGNPSFLVQAGPGELPPVQIRADNFDAFRTYALTRGWEVSSRAMNVRPAFDAARFDAFLDANTDLAKARGELLQYAASQGWQAPSP